jgi:hypothetical protein
MVEWAAIGGWLKVRVSPEFVQTQRLSMQQVRLALNAACQIRAGSATIPFQPSSRSRKQLLLP